MYAKNICICTVHANYLLQKQREKHEKFHKVNGILNSNQRNIVNLVTLTTFIGTYVKFLIYTSAIPSFVIQFYAYFAGL